MWVITATGSRGSGQHPHVVGVSQFNWKHSVLYVLMGLDTRSVTMTGSLRTCPLAAKPQALI